MASSHKSKAGPVRIIKRFTPQPATPAQELARLRHKLVLIEDRIADRQSYRSYLESTRGRREPTSSPRALIRLLEQQKQLQTEIAERS